MTGMVSLVGVGPGDPGLLTLRGVRAIARADVVVYDVSVHSAVLCHARDDAERLAVGVDGDDDNTSPHTLLGLLRAHVQAGRRIVCLLVGDPLFDAGGAALCAELAAHGVAFEIIPGIAEALGAASYVGVPLFHGTVPSSIAFADADALRVGGVGLVCATDTLVVRTAASRIREVTTSLTAHGRDGDTPASVIAQGTRPTQRVVVATLATLAARCDAVPFEGTVFVVLGDVVLRRAQLRWWDVGPLFGRRVVVTRARSQSASMLDDLRAEGAETLEFPALSFEAPRDPAPLARALDDLVGGAYALVLVTSANGVDWLFRALDARGLDARAFGRARVAAIGPATAKALRVRGLRADLVAGEFVGESLARDALALLGNDAVGARVLLARAEVARDVIPRALGAAGVSVDVVPVYRTVPAPVADTAALRAALADGRIDAVTFTSSSTVTQVCDALGPDAPALLARTAIASIGPITSQTARARGLAVALEAQTFTVAGLLDALREHFQPSERA